MLIGVVGKANVGKSTFFKALTLANVEIANYPFATIKPNHGIGFVKVDCMDKFFNLQCEPRFGYCTNHERFVPIDLLDVAGLVPGAHEGKGMGNQFLDDLRQADAFIHVVDIAGTTNERGEPVEPGSYNPLDDIKFLETELDMWFLRLLNKSWEKFARQTNQENAQMDKAIVKQFSGLGVTEPIVRKVMKKLNLLEKKVLAWDGNDLRKFASELRKETKPMIIAANKIDTKAGQENFNRINEAFKDYLIVPCSAESELALKEAAHHKLINYVPGENNFEITAPDKLNDKQKAALNFIKANILDKFGSTGVEDILDKAVFGLLRLMPVYPVANNKLSDKDGNILPDCFLVPQNTTALEFAFRVHTDIGNSFIRAIDMKTKQVVGKDHPLKPGDVIEIVAGK
ncbi:redox-regulated ATPase YchF [Candidatus Woesearchaeota archaeon]|nr:redox-regulated ATPase YchF [Candidatus Woesearchaeota archaeon]